VNPYNNPESPPGLRKPEAPAGTQRTVKVLDVNPTHSGPQLVIAVDELGAGYIVAVPQEIEVKAGDRGAVTMDRRGNWQYSREEEHHDGGSRQSPAEPA
jgi:hypothetical protein